ncbi:translation initiation factor IF-2-like [Neovison vison]|uniref:translation initiation factor IF-2-like n=1 Tax=Neovison vison TaxID=452646 RepID=UPI001CEFB205|nr:translation initiation factor IF-2-like [Neogale vison]
MRHFSDGLPPDALSPRGAAKGRARRQQGQRPRGPGERAPAGSRRGLRCGRRPPEGTGSAAGGGPRTPRVQARGQPSAGRGLGRDRKAAPRPPSCPVPRASQGRGAPTAQRDLPGVRTRSQRSRSRRAVRPGPREENPAREPSVRGEAHGSEHPCKATPWRRRPAPTGLPPARRRGDLPPPPGTLVGFRGPAGTAAPAQHVAWGSARGTAPRPRTRTAARRGGVGDGARPQPRSEPRPPALGRSGRGGRGPPGTHLSCRRRARRPLKPTGPCAAARPFPTTRRPHGPGHAGHRLSALTRPRDPAALRPALPEPPEAPASLRA